MPSIVVHPAGLAESGKTVCETAQLTHLDLIPLLMTAVPSDVQRPTLEFTYDNDTYGSCRQTPDLGIDFSVEWS